MSSEVRQWMYAAALVVGLAVPAGVINPWLVEHGPDLPLLLDQLFDTGVSTFFAVDVVIAVVTLLLLVTIDEELPRHHRVIVAIASLLGASVGLPLYLLLRERARASAGGSPRAMTGG